MRGKFSFYSDGHKVAEAYNVITNRGKIVIGNYLSEARSSWADELAIGAMGTATSLENVSLGLEFWREPIDLKSYSFADEEIIVRGTIPGSVVGKIYELGVYSKSSPTSISSSGPVLCYFDNSVEDWAGGEDDTLDTRVGSRSLKITSSGPEESAAFTFFGNIRSYNQNSVFRLGYTGSGTVSSVSVKIKVDGVNFREYAFSPNTSGSYSVESWGLSDFSITGGASIFEFFIIEVSVVGAGSIVFDVLSVSDESTEDFSDVLVSRAIIDQNGLDFINKLPVRELQIEYAIELGDGVS